MAEVLTVPNLEQREKSHRFPFMMPGGKAVLITISRTDVSSHDDSRIGVLSLREPVEGTDQGRHRREILVHRPHHLRSPRRASRWRCLIPTSSK